MSFSEVYFSRNNLPKITSQNQNEDNRTVLYIPYKSNSINKFSAFFSFAYSIDYLYNILMCSCQQSEIAESEIRKLDLCPFAFSFIQENYNNL